MDHSPQEWWPCQTPGMEQRLSLVTLGVGDFARSRAFYESLGWAGESPDGEVIFFQAGGMVVALWSRELLAEDSVVAEDPGGWGGITLAHNTRSRDEVDSILEEVEAAGGTVARKGAETPWGGYSGLFVDPDGHRWEVAHNPGWAIAADGAVSLQPPG